MPTPRCRCRFLPPWLFTLALVTVAPVSGAAITGVCPDGSIFIAQTREGIPCENAKETAPDEVPPLRPEYLPSPYTWQVYREKSNPNNPYNLVDAARQVRALRDGQTPPVPGPPQGADAAGAPPRGFADAGRPAPRAAERIDLGLTDGELRDLFLIVEYAQHGVAARFEKQSLEGEPVMEISLAHSASFESRFRRAWRMADPVRVLLFTVLAREPDRFDPNFTFVQGHLNFHPNPVDPRQLGVLQGEAGPLGRDEVVLGYVVLPERIDLEIPVDVYWNDRRITVAFQP